MHSEIVLAELLATKICHDFSGGLGAIHNGIEFIEEEGHLSTSDTLLNMISSNTSNLISKIKLYRFMFGISSSDGVANLENVKMFLSGVLESSKTELLWDLEYTSINNKQAKLLALFAYIAHDNLIYGGSLHIALSTPDSKSIVCNIKCSSSKVQVREYLSNLFISKQEIIPSLDNLFPVIANINAKEIGADIMLQISENQFAFSIKFNRESS